MADFSDDEIPEIPEDPDTDFDVYEISGDDDDLAIGFYSKMRIYLAYYNNVKYRYKKLSITWILATFIAFAYILTGKEALLPLDPLVSTSLVAVCCAVGISLLCFLDIGVYHRYIEAVFAAALELEERERILPLANHNIKALLIKGTMGPTIFDASFYMFFLTLLLIVALLSWYAYINPFRHSEAVLAFGGGLLLLALVNGLIVLAAKRSSLPALFSQRRRHTKRQ